MVAAVVVAPMHTHALAITEVYMMIGVIDDQLLWGMYSARGTNSLDIRAIKIGRVYRAIMVRSIPCLTGDSMLTVVQVGNGFSKQPFLAGL